MSNFGNRLKKIRKEKKITQNQLSKALGVAQSTIANYENNTRFPVESTLVELADYLNVSLDYLMGLRNQKNEIKEVSYDQLKEKVLYHLLRTEEKEATDPIKESFRQGIPFTHIMEKVVLPVMVEVGNLWETGQINVAQEHYFTNVMENLIVQLSDEFPTDLQKSFKVLLMVPGYEEHLLTLKIASAYFKHKGWKVFFIGKSVPIKDLEKIMTKENVDAVVVSITIERHLNSGEHLIHSIKRFNLKKNPIIIVGGSAIKNKQLAVDFLGTDKYISRVTDLEYVIDELEDELK